MDLPRARAVSDHYGSHNKPVVVEALRYTLLALDAEMRNHADTNTALANANEKLRDMTGERDQWEECTAQLQGDLDRVVKERNELLADTVELAPLVSEKPVEANVVVIGDAELDAMQAIVEAFNTLGTDEMQRRVMDYITDRFQQHQ